MNKLFILGAYVVPRIVRESRLTRDLTMPERDWSKYEEAAFVRNPGYITHSRERHRAPVVKVQVLPFMLRRQAQ